MLDPQPAPRSRQLPLPTGLDANPTGTAIQTAAHALAGAAFGGFYHDGDAYYVGFTSNVSDFLTQLQSQFPGVELHGYTTPRGADELEAVSVAIEATMLSADPLGQILYAVPNETAGLVDVGVRDPSSALAQELPVQHGDLIRIIKDELLRPLSATAPHSPRSKSSPRPVRRRPCRPSDTDPADQPHG